MAKKQIATFLGTQLGLSVLENHIYAYSGVKGVIDSETTMLKGSTGKYYAVSEVQFLSNMNSGDDYVAKIYLNNGVIAEFILSATNDAAPFGYYPFNLIIPPNTEVKITLHNVTDTSSNNWDVQLTGRIYNV